MGKKYPQLSNSFYKIKKRRRQANKKSLNSDNILTIKNEFKYWLLGIEEDDEMPFEVNYFCFCFDFRNNSVDLSVSGFEKEPKVIDKGSYNPLEAQFFNCELLNAYFNNKQNLNIKNRLYEYKKQEIFKLFYETLKSFQNDINFLYLKGKTILLGEFLKEKAYKFIFNIYK